MRILVLGASGFIGRHVVAGISQAGGLIPIAASRHPDPASGVEARRVDATDRSSLTAAVADADAIVNCIAASAPEMVAATRLVCAVAESRRVVHLSSMAVYGGATGRVDETHGLAPVGDYAVSKAQSEELLRDHVAAGGNAVILRPGCVHGPGSEQWTGRIARLLRAGRLGDLGPDGDGICNLTAAADLAVAVAVAVRKPGLNGEALNVSDREPDRWNVYFKRFAVAIGATPLPHIPRWQLRAERLLAYPLKAGEVAAHKVKLRTPDPIPPSLLRMFTQEITLDHRKADRMLGFPRTPPNVALQSAVQWLQRRH